MDDKKLSRTVKEIVARLVVGDYNYLERLTNGTRLTKSEMLRAVTEYPASLVMPPESSFENIDIIEIEGTAATQYSVRFDLWSAYNGRSDLTLELTFFDNDRGLYDVQIEDIHVL
jgi:hypothetical protein